ncbi:MAG: hypothetical protein QW057_07630 [Candidatus Bathyarchaeia archaeon]
MKPRLTVRAPLILEVQVEREDLYWRVKKLIQRLEQKIYAKRTRQHERAAATRLLAELVGKASRVLSDYEVEALEREIEELEEKSREAKKPRSNP